MKRIGWLVVVGAILLAGCGKPGETVVTGPNGEKVTVDQNGNGSVNMTDGKGNQLSMNAGGVSEGDLGLPFYPGSTEMAAGSMKMDTPEGHSVTSSRSTTDPVQKVIDFYKGEMEKAGYKVQGTMVSGDNGTVAGKKSDQDNALAAVGVSDGRTTINVTVVHSTASPSPASTPAASPSPSSS